MRKSKFTESQIVAILAEGESARVRHQMTQIIDSYRARFKLATTKESTGRFG
jgi:hypothetical protein